MLLEFALLKKEEADTHETGDVPEAIIIDQELSNKLKKTVYKKPIEDLLKTKETYVKKKLKNNQHDKECIIL